METTVGFEFRAVTKRLRSNIPLLLCSGLIVYIIVVQYYPREDRVAMEAYVSTEFDQSASGIGASQVTSGSREDHVTSTGTRPIRRTINTIKPTSPCTFGLFRKIYIRDHYFPTGGRWVNSTPENILHYHPKSCRLKYPRIPKSFMEQCLAKANLSSVSTLGDSTVSRYFKALTQASGRNCKVVRRENLSSSKFLPDKEYFTSEIDVSVRDFVKVQYRFCGGCAGSEVLCSDDGTTSAVRFEHIAQTMILDDTIHLSFPDAHNPHIRLDKIWSITSQEFIFRYFMKDRYPQILLIFLPFVHAKHNLKLDRVAMEIQYFKSLVEYYVPNTTKLIYMPSYSEFEIIRQKDIWYGRKYDVMLAI
jgi:hypothetical protein